MPFQESLQSLADERGKYWDVRCGRSQSADADESVHMDLPEDLRPRPERPSVAAMRGATSTVKAASGSSFDSIRPRGST